MAMLAWAYDSSVEEWEKKTPDGYGTTRYERQWVYVVFAILAWAAFWNIADQYRDNRHAVRLSWLVLMVAILVAYNL